MRDKTVFQPLSSQVVRRPSFLIVNAGLSASGPAAAPSSSFTPNRCRNDPPPYPRPLQEYMGKTCDVLFLGEHGGKGEHEPGP